jgi:predicted NAD-dependent protein-ADP-ribosyltransferase YbiA (DUF1768 family)
MEDESTLGPLNSTMFTYNSLENPNIGKIERPVNLGGTASNLPVYNPIDMSSLGDESPEFRNQSFEEMINSIDTSEASGKLGLVSGKILPTSSDRYKSVFAGRDYEEMYGQQQSSSEKWANGFVKMLGTGATTFISGTVGTVYGIGKMLQEERLAAFYDNDVNRKMDEYNKKMEDALPNYYTQAESSANWYSSKNIWTANFWSDKVIKNLGFSIGSMGGGVAWGAVLNNIGKINSLVRAGKSLETIEGVELAMRNANGVSKFGAVSKALNGLSNKYIKPVGAGIIANGERATVSLMGSMGEASLEALGNMNDFRDKLISRYEMENGYLPEGEDLNEINEIADHVGNFTWGMNVALLTATNYIQLPKIFNSSKSLEKKMINEIVKEEIETGSKLGVSEIAEKVSTKYIAKKSFLETTLGRPGKVFNNYLINPATLLFAPSEAFEEGMQYAVTEGVQDYFNKASLDNDYTSDFWNNTIDAMGNVFTYGVKEALTSKEGLESILIGGISGGIQTSFSPFGQSTVKERGLFGTGGVRGRNTQAAIDEINSSKNLTQVLSDYKKFANIGIVSQKNRQEAIADNDVFNEKNYEKDYVLSYIMPRVKYGKLESVKEEIDLYRKQALTEEGFEDLVAAEIALPEETREQFLQKLNNIQSVAEQVAKTYNVVNDKYSNLYTDSGERLYSNDVIDKLVYASSKVVDFDERLKSLSSELSKLGYPLTSLQNVIFQNEAFKNEDYSSAIKDENVINEINNLFNIADEQDPTQLENYREKILDFSNMLVERDRYIKEYQKIQNSPEEYKTVDPTVTDADGNVLDENGKIVPKETITVKVKDNKTGQVVDKKIEIGTEYLLGKVVKYDKDGNEVIQDPVLTILADNSDGTYKIKDKNGIRNVSAQVLEDYQLSKLSDITSDKKKNYVYVNRNNTFSNKLIKDTEGKPVVGRLEYNQKEDKLTFVYKNEKGKVKRSEVWNNMFKAQEGYKEAIITKVGTLTAEEQKTTEEFVNAPTTISQKLQTRNNIILDLYDKSVKRLDEITKKLNTSKERTAKAIEALENQLASESLTKAGKPRKNQTPAMKKIINELSSLQDLITKENEQLLSEKEELESNVPFFKDYLDNLETLPESGKEMIKLLKDDINTLEDLIDITSNAIKDNDSLLKQIEDVLMKALSIFNDYIKRLQQENPSVPLFIDDLQTNLEKALGDEGAQYYIDNKQGITSQVLELESDINDFSAELKIPTLNKKAEDLVKDITDLKEGLDKLISEQIAKREILNAFEQYAENIKEQKRQEQELARNEKLIQEWVGTMDNSIQPVAADSDKEKVYEGPSKKSDRDVVQGTIPVNNDRPHNLRANRFGNRFNSFSDKKQKAIKGRIVTLKTEELQGVKGLSELITAGEADPSDVIAMVMVIENNDTYSLVDELGNPFNDEQKQNPLEHAVFQVFPSDKLEQKYMKDGKRVMETMFRESTDKDLKESLSKQYREWRTSVMTKDTLSPPLGINASFGLPEYVTRLVEKVVNGKTMQVEEINYDATTPVEKTGLVNKESLGNDKLITISTSNGVSEGSVTFKTDAGRVFLTVPGGLIKLNNRKLNTKEATAVYEAILQLSKIAFDKGTIKDDVQAQQIVRWLKTVVYWGIAKNPQTGQRKQAGYNNIWFEDVVNEKGEKSSKLFISGMGANLSFTPSEISSRRSELVSMIGALYHNVNKTLTDERSWSNPYTEIVGFDKNGETLTREWKNYQTYLLSSEGRTEQEIPLTTIVRPKTSENDVVKKAVYFTYMDNADTFNFEITKPAEVVKKETQPVTPQQPVVTPPVQTKQGEIEFSITSPFSVLKPDGKTVHKYKMSVGFVNVIINEDGTPDFAFKDEDDNITDDETNDTIDALVEKNKKEPGELIGKIMNQIYSIFMTGQIVSEIPTDNAVIAAPVVEAPVAQPAAPVSDIEAKKAEKPVINIYWGSPESSTNTRVLSNLAPRKFTYQGKEYGSVEHAYQTLKSGNFDQATYDKYVKAGGYGTKIRGKAVQKGFDNLQLMRDLVVESFKQNPEQAKLLLNYSDFTHTTNEVIDKAFLDGIKLAQKNAELAALEGAKPAEEKPTAPEQPSSDPFSSAPKTSGVNEIDDTQFRIAYKEATTYPTENFDKVAAWLKAKLPNIPVYRVKNIIQATNGRQAWGMLHKGAIYLYENAEIGTAYHEVFEAVWAMMTTPAERNAIAKDFRRREGSYVDRFTGETVVYKDATDDQMREELAEEFREYVMYSKNPKEAPAPKTPSFLKRIFDDIINAIKAFFVGDNNIQNTKELFDKIGEGYYRKYIPSEQKLSFANVGYIDIETVLPDNSSKFSLAKIIQNISATEIHQLMQQMTSSTIVRMIGNNDDLFNITKMNRTEMYNILKNEILNKRIKPMADQIGIDAVRQERKLTEQENFAFNNLRTLYNNIANQWPLIQKKHEEYLLSYGITFDENDDIDYNQYEKSKDEGWGDARKIDAFKKLNSTIKLLLASIAETRIVDGKIRPKFNNIGGVNLLPLGSVYVDLLNQLHDAVDQPDMIRKFREAARQNPNYNALFTRIFKIDPLSENAIDYSKLNKSDLRIIEGFWKTFKKQSPTVSALFILPNGEVVVGDSNTSGLVREYRRQFLNNFITKARTNDTPYIAKHPTKGFIPTNKLLALQQTQDLGVLVKFLDNLGIEFSLKTLENKKDLQKEFREATNGLIRSLKERVTEEGIERINANTLNASNRLLELGLVKAKLETSDAETTYFNINGERSQTFLGPNLLSSFYDVISQVDTIYELEGTNFGYLLTDSYSTIGSVVLDRIFDEKGNKRKGVFAEMLKPYLVDGTIDEDSGKNTESSKLNKRQRYIQELNMNINGVYMNLVPGDANMQTAIKLHEKDSPFVTEDMLLNKTYMEIFKNQLISEIVMSRESDRPLAKGRNGKDLRFYKEILGESLHKKVVRVAQETDKSAEAIYDQFETEIKDRINDFINNKSNKSIDKLMSFGIISKSDDGKYSVEDITLFKNEETYTLENIRNQMKIQQMNFMIANTELHKLLYSDPYQYSDELKRIKNFSSPRQILSYGNSGSNSRYNVLYNNEEEDKLFNTNFNRDTINGATISDVLSDNEELNYSPFEETDGGGYITDKGKRYVKIKNGEWTDENEEQYIYDMAYMKKVLGVKLSQTEQERLKKGNPNNQSNYTPEKPIVAGNKNMGRDYNDIILDKFALFPISFRMIHELNPNANMLKLYQKMIQDEVDYVVYQTGRKVGAENVYQLYNRDGSFNEAPLISEEEKKNPLGKQTVFTLPLSIFAIQTEVPTKEDNQVTQGSQPTKLATMDFMQAGVPIDFMPEESDFEKRFDEWIKLLDKGSYNEGDNLYNELKNNQALLEERIENGLEKLFKKLGIKKTGEDSYTLDKPELTFELLKEELLKREVNDNVVAALNGYEDGKFVLEAIPSYQQIRNILYSVAHKSVVSPKLKGGQKVQVSSALLESVRAEAKEVNGKLVYQSDILNFYKDEDGKRTCEIMIARWFDSPLSDEQLMNYFNNTPEGQKELSALTGVAFRIPTQKQNSIEAFKIAKFLPQGFGDSVIVPSALVKKVGSDFDIDKLFIYLKNLYKSKNGSLKVIPYFGIGKEAKSKIEQLYDSGELDEYIKSVKNALPEGAVEDRLFKSIFPEEYAASKQEVIDKFYRESLDNAYISSFEKLVSHPLNFINLVKPNSAKQMQDLTSEIETLVGIQKPNYMDISLMLDREFMSELRNDFVRGKYNIGIAATSQTGNAQSQRGLLTIDRSKLYLSSEKDRRFLQDGSIRFINFNSVKGMPTLSKIQDDNSIPEDRNYISDVIGQVIDGFVDVNKDPWVMRLGITTNTAGTWLFLIRLGVPLRDVAFFMNQPIIRDFLQTLENNGYSYLFSSNVIDAVRENYETNIDDVEFSTIPSETELKSMMGKDELSPLENAKQLFILDEFLKYSKMAEHLLTFTQATNFDTATFNDPFLVFKKRMQIERARKTIFADVDDFLDASFIGKLREAIDTFRDGISEILLSDRKENPNGESIRSVLETVLMPYVNKSDSDFISASKKAVLTLFDWAVQTDRKINTELSRVLLYKEGEESVASKVMKLKKEAENPKHKLHDNYVLKSVQAEVTEKEGEPDNLYISAIGTKVYDQNQIIYGLREIKKFLPENQKDLYGGIVRLAVLQSGLTNSRIAYTSLLPFEDFVEVYNQTLSKIDKMPNLSDFVDVNVFERSNWSDTDIVPSHKEKVIKTKKGTWFKPETTMVSKKLEDAMLMGEIPRTVNISNYSQEAQHDVITFIWSDMSLTKNQKRDMAKRGDYSFMNKGLFKKVYAKNKEGVLAPIVYETTSKDKKTGKVTVYKNYVYKMINAWGDSIYAKEFYGKAHPLIASSTTSFPSVMNNGYEKVENNKQKEYIKGEKVITKGEVEDAKIVEILGTSAYVEGDEFIFTSEEESLPLPTEENKPKGLPSISRTNKKC